MTIRSRARRVVVGLLLATSVASAGNAESDCEYRRVHVDPAVPVGARAAELRITTERHARLLDAARSALPALGLVATDRDDAYWRLSAHGASVPGTNRLHVSVELDAGVRLQNHIFLAQLDREDFPYRGETGGSISFDIAPTTRWEIVESRVAGEMAPLWDRESEQISALCDLRAELQREGWSSIEDLRLEILDGMKRVRRERGREPGRRLELEVDSEPRP